MYKREESFPLEAQAGVKHVILIQLGVAAAHPRSEA
jgi:hypothetical protein